MNFNVYAAEQHRAILGLGPSFGESELKKVYRGLLWQWHPDRKYSESLESQAQANEKTKELNLAYEFLVRDSRMLWWYLSSSKSELPCTFQRFFVLG